MKQNKLLALLGLAMRAGKVVSGELQTLEAIKKGNAWLVLVAGDASDNSRKLYKDKCSFYEVPVFEYGTREELGKAIGKDFRSAVCVCDEGFAVAITKKLQEAANVE